MSAERRRDIMGYCYKRGWLSDYYFEKVIEYRERVESDRAVALASGAAPGDETLVLWGGGGGVQVSTTAPATLPPPKARA